MPSYPRFVKVTLHENSHGIPQDLKKKMEMIDHILTTINNSKQADDLIQNSYQVKQWDAIMLMIENTSKDGIVKGIGNINFPHLKRLILYHDNILSVEMLGRLNAEILQGLIITNNNVVNVSQLRKMQSYHLQSIKMGYNPVNNAECLVEASWTILQYQQLPPSQSNMSFCAKYDHKYNFHLYSASMYGDRILEKSVIKSIIQKYLQSYSVQITSKNETYTKKKQPQ